MLAPPIHLSRDLGRPLPRPHPPVHLGAPLHRGDLELPIDLGPAEVSQRPVLGSRQGVWQGATKEETKHPPHMATPLPSLLHPLTRFSMDSWKLVICRRVSLSRLTSFTH